MRGRGQAAVLVDTNVILEAVRTRCWNAVSGALRMETVEECREETRRGDGTRAGYVPVTEADLDRLAAVHVVTATERAVFLLARPDAQGLDAGERDLFAHAYARMERGDDVWLVCSADRTAIRVALGLGWGDRIRSLGALVEDVGAQPRHPLSRHYGEPWLREFRTACLLGGRSAGGNG